MLYNRPEGVRIQDGLGYLSIQPAAGGGGIAFVQAATQVDVSASSTTAPAITITGATGGNCIIGLASIYDADEDYTITDVTDGANSFTNRSAVWTRVGGGERGYGSAAYAVNITGGDRTVAWNLSGTSAGADRYYSLGCLEFSGVKTSTPEDTFDANDEIDTSATDISAGPITTTNAGDLIVGSAAGPTGDDTLNYASPTSWTNSYRQNQGSSVIGFDAGYWLPGATQTNYTAQWSHDNVASSEGAGVVVALLPA